MSSRALVKRNNVQSKDVSSLVQAVALPVLKQLVSSRGQEWVVQQVVSGALRLAPAASRWWTSQVAGFSSADVVTAVAPTSVGVAIRGNARMNGNIRVRHRELISSVSSSSIHSYRLSPADSFTFPYLSTLASSYDKYKFHSLKLVVVSGVPTTSGSRWYAAWDIDSTDSAPLDPMAFMAMQHSMSMSSWQSGEMNIPASQKKLLDYYTDDLKDHGRLFFYPPVTNPVYDLYLEYDVELCEPNIVAPTQIAKKGYETLLLSGTMGATYGPSYILPAPTPTPKQFQLPAGCWMLQSQIRGTGAQTPGAWTITPLSNTNLAPVVSQRVSTATSGADNYRSVTVRAYGPVLVTVGDATNNLLPDRCSLVVSPVSLSGIVNLEDAYM